MGGGEIHTGSTYGGGGRKGGNKVVGSHLFGATKAFERKLIVETFTPLEMKS